MTNAFEFTNGTARELVELLDRRANERLAADADRLSALLGMALLVVAEVLRNPIEKAPDRGAAADQMVDSSARWLRKLLQPVT
jgi:hypothetical protein